jgi:hypothetical protein
MSASVSIWMSMSRLPNSPFTSNLVGFFMVISVELLVVSIFVFNGVVLGVGVFGLCEVLCLILIVGVA